MRALPAAVEVEAPAKVNLVLRILGRQRTGFHDLETLFQAVGLYDRLHVARATEPGVRLQSSGLDAGPAEANLVVRAARAYLEAAGSEQGVEIRLDKRIPPGAGLGGGSADAGATLRALDRLLGGAVPPARLVDLAADLGSDVPFFVGASPFARGGGRGERLEPLRPLPAAGVVLGLPPVHVSTGSAYAALARAREHAGEAVPPHVLTGAPPGDWHRVAELAMNDFERVVLPAYPAVARSLAALRAGDAPLALLSGSGGAVFALYPNLAHAQRAAEAARDREPRTTFISVPTLTAWPEVREA